MEQATLPRSHAAAAGARPPGTRLPALAQVALYGRDPLGFLIRCQRRYGDVFSVSFPFYRGLVYVADPALVKQLFTGSPERNSRTICTSLTSKSTRPSVSARTAACTRFTVPA